MVVAVGGLPGCLAGLASGILRLAVSTLHFSSAVAAAVAA